MANITVKELIKRLKELPSDHVVSEDVINKVHSLINFSEIKSKSVHITLDVTIPIEEVINYGYYEDREETFLERLGDVNNSEELVDFISEWMNESDQMSEVFYGYTLEII